MPIPPATVITTPINPKATRPSSMYLMMAFQVACSPPAPITMSATVAVTCSGTVIRGPWSWAGDGGRERTAPQTRCRLHG